METRHLNRSAVCGSDLVSFHCHYASFSRALSSSCLAAGENNSNSQSFAGFRPQLSWQSSQATLSSHKSTCGATHSGHRTYQSAALWMLETAPRKLIPSRQGSKSNCSWKLPFPSQSIYIYIYINRVKNTSIPHSKKNGLQILFHLPSGLIPL